MPIPQLQSKFDSEISINPLEMLLKNNKATSLTDLPSAPTNCIISPITKIKETLHSELELTAGPNLIAPLYVPKDNSNIAVFCDFVGFGAPMWSWIFEQLVAYGIKNFVYIGVFGKVNPAFDNESIYVVEKALRDEGVSYHYANNNDKWAYPDKDLTSELIKNGARPVSLWTTDCMFRQTISEINYACGNNIAGFEMECSALFAIAKEKGVKIASLQVVSDYYLDGKFTSIFSSDLCTQNLNKATDLAIKVLNK